MLEVPTVGRMLTAVTRVEVNCLQAQPSHRKGCQEVIRLANPRGGGIRVQRQQVCVRTQAAGAAPCLRPQRPVCGVGSSQCRDWLRGQSSENKGLLSALRLREHQRRSRKT